MRVVKPTSRKVSRPGYRRFGYFTQTINGQVEQTCLLDINQPRNVVVDRIDKAIMIAQLLNSKYGQQYQTDHQKLLAQIAVREHWYPNGYIKVEGYFVHEQILKGVIEEHLYELQEIYSSEE